MRHAPRPTMRLLALAIAVAASAGAHAANYNPRIAYTSYEGKGDSLYLANADGSLKVLVYKTNKTTISGLDLAPGRVAFVESGILKLFSYTATANGIVATPPVTVDAFGAPYQGALQPDFSPDGTHLLYTRWVQDPVTESAGAREIRVVPVNASAPAKVLVSHTDLADTKHIGSPRWISNSEFLFDRQGGSPWSMSLMLASLDGNKDLTGAPLTLFTNTEPGFASLGVSSWEDFDVSRTGLSILISANRNSGAMRDFVQYDLLAHSFTKRFSDYGWRAHFQAGDASVVYVHLPASFSTYGNGVYRWNAATNTANGISGKGSQVIRYSDTLP